MTEIRVPTLGEVRYRGDHRPLVQEGRPMRLRSTSRWSSSKTDKVTIESPPHPPPARWARSSPRTARRSRSAALLGQINDGRGPPPRPAAAPRQGPTHPPSPPHHRLHLPAAAAAPAAVAKRHRRADAPLAPSVAKKFPPRAASIAATVPGLRARTAASPKGDMARRDREGRPPAPTPGQSGPPPRVQVRAPSPGRRCLGARSA